MKIYSYLLGISLLILSSCGSSKPSEPALSGSQASTMVGDSGHQTGQTLAQKAEALALSYKEWSEMSVPLKVELKSPAQFSASGKAYMRRGKDVYITIRMLGFEVATAYIDADSIRVADKFNKRYMAEPISKALAGADLTVADIQDVLLGRVFVNSKGTFGKSMLKSVELAEAATGDGLTITPKSKVAGASYSFSVLDNPLRLASLNVEAAGRTASCAYSSPELTASGVFMEVADIAATLGGKKINVALKWDFSNVKFEVSNSIRWKTPKNYKRLQAASLLKGLKL